MSVQTHFKHQGVYDQTQRNLTGDLVSGCEAELSAVGLRLNSTEQQVDELRTRNTGDVTYVQQHRVQSLPLTPSLLLFPATAAELDAASERLTATRRETGGNGTSFMFLSVQIKVSTCDSFPLRAAGSCDGWRGCSD